MKTISLFIVCFLLFSITPVLSQQQPPSLFPIDIKQYLGNKINGDMESLMKPTRLPPKSRNLQNVLGRWGYGPTFAVFVKDNMAFLGNGSYLTIADISNPSNIQKKSEVLLPSFIKGIFVEGNYAYVANFKDGLRIIDINSITNPHEAGFCLTDSLAEDVFVLGNYAYVADGGDGLCIIDISTKSNPQKIKNYDTPGYANGVFVSGNYAYIADMNKGLRVIDVFYPSSPHEVGYDTTRYVNDVYVSGNYIYSADNYSNPPFLRIFDISNPNKPYEVGNVSTGFVSGWCNRVFVSANYAYIAGSALAIFDVSHKSAPQKIGQVYLSNGAYVCWDLFVKGDTTAYVATEGEGFAIADVGNKINPTQIGFFQNGGISTVMDISENIAVIGHHYTGFHLLDLSNPIKPDILAYLDETHFHNGADYIRSVFLSGNYAYVATGHGGGSGYLYIIDISNPQIPQMINPGNPFYVGTGEAGFVTVKSDTAYVVNSSNGLRIIDVKNKSNPHEIGFFNSNNECTINNIYVSGAIAYISCGTHGLHILDVSKMPPVEKGLLSAPKPPDPGYFNYLDVQGNYAYITTGGSGLKIIDISNLSFPREKNSFRTRYSYANGVTISGDYAYVAYGYNGLCVIDISNPSNLREIGYYDTGYFVEGSKVVGNYIDLLDEGTGLYILKKDPIFTGLFGDVKGDGKVTPFDGSKILRYKVGLDTLGCLQRDSIAADVSGNASLSSFDAGYIFDYVAGIITKFPVEDGSPIQTSKTAKAPLRKFIVGNPEIKNEVFKIPLSIENVDYLYSMDLELGFSPQKFQLLNIESAEQIKNKKLLYNVTGSRIKIAMAGGENNINGDGNILNLAFKILSNETNISDLVSVESILINEDKIAIEIINQSGKSDNLPTEYMLYQNYPNPFNPVTTIKFQLPSASHVSLIIYNILGQQVKTLVNEVKQAGSYSVQWNSRNDAGLKVASGIYICRIKAGTYVKNMKMVMMQ